MSQILEATMLVCFGLSWPVSVVKNIKAKTAKSMSLQFILLIITGYIAGIMSKFYSRNINYVLIVYLFNLLAVSVNMAVYFINRRYDRAKELTVGEEVQEMKPNVKYNMYREMNNMANQGGIVFFGSNTFADLPVSELAKSHNLEESIYNRSICDEEISGLTDALDLCVYQLSPSKVFVNIGDADLIKDNLNADEFMSKYEWILYSIYTKTHADIYVVSIISSLPIAQTINHRLKNLAEETGSHYIDATSVINSASPKKHLFELLKLYIRNHPLSFADVMLG